MTDETDLQPVVAAEFIRLGRPARFGHRDTVGYAVALRGLAGPRGDRAPDDGGALFGGGVHGRIAALRFRLHPRYRIRSPPATPSCRRDELVKSLRSEVMRHWTPPGGGCHGALNHVVIHGLDVTVPLGVPRRSPDATIRVILDDLTDGDVQSVSAPTSRGAACRPPTSTGHIGAGPVLRGAAAYLALVLCGRATPEGRLEGKPL